jgi:hypothetical protein
MDSAIRAGADAVLALGLHDRLMPLHMAMFLETSPAPVKYALSVLGKCRETLRLLLCPSPNRHVSRSATPCCVGPDELIDDDHRGVAPRCAFIGGSKDAFRQGAPPSVRFVCVEDLER